MRSTRALKCLRGHSNRSSARLVGASLAVEEAPATWQVNCVPRSSEQITMQDEATSSLPHRWADVGIQAKGQIFHNLTYDEIRDHEEKQGDGTFLKSGAYAVRTGKFTGRSPADRYFVKQYPGTNLIDWGKVNIPMEPNTFDKLHSGVRDHLSNVGDLYVFDGYCGASDTEGKKVRFITERAWQHHFVTNMFIRPPRDDLEEFIPDFTVLNAPGYTNPDWQEEGLNSESFGAFNIEKQTGVIGGLLYAGEMKKGIFSSMNYWLPLQRNLPMHCSANIGVDNDTALFFGLSGTGKTTLSADPNRRLIGDDEHGWDDNGIFNFEGGCYAKTYKLREESEPEIYRAIRTNALLENVWFDPETMEIDFDNKDLTENGRVSYPIFHIDNREESLAGGHPSNVVFLAADAFGVLPPISRLTNGQAMYHFLSGYTAKVAGTERGITEPQPTFSPCFGAAFMTHHPIRYGELLKEKLEKYGSKVYLINSGWSGGAYGVGERMSIQATRTCVDAIFNGAMDNAEYRIDPVFGFEVPVALDGVDSKILNPRSTWEDQSAYDAEAEKLATMFKNNFSNQMGSQAGEYAKYGPY